MAEWEFNVRPVLKGINLTGISVDQQSILLKIAASEVMSTIISGWPIDTGLSIGKFRTEKRGKDWWVTNNVDYTKYVHGGLVDELAAKGLVKARPEVERRAKQMRTGVGERRGRLRRRSAGGKRVPLQAARTRATAVSIEANALRDSLRIVGRLAADGTVPRSVVTLVKQGKLVQAGRALRAAGETRAAGQIEQIARRGRRV